MVPSPSISYSWNAPKTRTVNWKSPQCHSRHTFELLVQPPARGDTQSADELFKVDGAVFVLVEDVEYIVGKLARFTEWEKLLIYPAELLLVELATWTILEEALVPVKRPRLDEREGSLKMVYHCWSSRFSTIMAGS